MASNNKSKKNNKNRKKNLYNKDKLVIVESPSKAKTIENYLGKDFDVISTKGHIMDLPKSTLGVKIEDNFQPTYRVIKDKKDVIKELKERAKNKTSIFLASDNDREGEAIAYHVYLILKDIIKNDKAFKRIVFNEITKDVIKNAVKNPSEIDFKKVEAQKARRVLDRLVGYKISPILWKKIQKAISAGRVQTVALRFIVDREKERENFQPEKYYKVKGIFKKKFEFEAELVKFNEKKVNFKDKKLIDEIIDAIKNEKTGIVKKINIKKTKLEKKPPFITATLQQEAFNRFGFSAKKTMRIAQDLYEGIDLANQRKGLITYMRTDSTRISKVFIQQAKQFIIENYGEEEIDLSEKILNKKDNFTQDAHEAIRPTDITLKPEDVKKYLSQDQYKIYTIIWERTLSVFMKAPEIENKTILIDVNNAIFNVVFKRILFKGYLKIIKYLKPSQKFVKDKEIPELLEDERIEFIKYKLEEKETEPPARYTEASLIKKLKESGIGRPSTYAPIISVLYERNYIEKKDKKLVPTKLGRIVCDTLIKNFKDIFNYDFTANMEKELDKIEDGESDYYNTIANFWKIFAPEVENFSKIDSLKSQLTEETSIKCEKCNGKMLLRNGRYGKFLGCENYPECKNTLSAETYGFCPKCKIGVIVKRKGSKGKYFFGCSRYPDCDWISNKAVPLKCIECGANLIMLESKKIFKCINKDCGKEYSYEEIKKNILTEDKTNKVEK